VITTGDDHGNNGTASRFDQFIAASPTGCSVANWECVRGTSYMYPDTPLTNEEAAAYDAAGFEVGLHVNTNCADYTPASLEAFYTQQISDFAGKYNSIPLPITQRHHCIAWSDWVTGAKVQLNHGIRQYSLIMEFVSIPAIISGHRAGLPMCRVCLPVPQCRCVSLISTVRSSMFTMPQRK